MNGEKTNKLKVYSAMLHEYEKKELRIIKQAIAKSFIESGRTDLQLSEQTQRMMEEWIKWIYRDEEKDRKLVREREQPF